MDPEDLEAEIREQDAGEGLCSFGFTAKKTVQCLENLMSYGLVDVRIS